MRKYLQSLLAVFAILMVCGVANAQFDKELDITRLFDNNSAIPKVEGAYNRLLTEYDNERGYEKGQLTCDATSNSIKITSPIIYDTTANSWEEVKYYDVFLSPYRLDELKSNNNIDSSKIIKKRVPFAENMKEIPIELSSSDGLDSNQVYYGFIVPISAYDLVGAPSEEICFQMSNTMCVQGSECDSIAPLVSITNDQGTGTHGSADSDHGAANCTSMKYANIHCKRTDDNTVYLRWTAVSDGSLDIAVLNPDTNQYEVIGKGLSVSDEKFEYKMKWNGEYNLSFDNGCDMTPYRRKCDAKIEASTGKKVSEKIVTPATGPAENILYIVIAAIVLYGAYAIFGRKSEN